MSAPLKQDRKTEIVAAASELIQRYGYDSFSYKDLSTKLGITKAGIHHHFPSKEDLGLAVCEAAREGFHQFFNGLAQIDGFWSMMEELRKEGLEMVNTGRICPITALQADDNSITEAMRNQMALVSNEEFEYWEKQIRKAADANEIVFKGDAADVAVLFVGVLKGVMMLAKEGGGERHNQVFSILKQQFST